MKCPLGDGGNEKKRKNCVTSVSGSLRAPCCRLKCKREGKWRDPSRDEDILKFNHVSGIGLWVALMFSKLMIFL